jgi:hypothetical protein
MLYNFTEVFIDFEYSFCLLFFHISMFINIIILIFFTILFNQFRYHFLFSFFIDIH